IFTKYLAKSGMFSSSHSHSTDSMTRIVCSLLWYSRSEDNPSSINRNASIFRLDNTSVLQLVMIGLWGFHRDVHTALTDAGHLRSPPGRYNPGRSSPVYREISNPIFLFY